MAKKQYSMIAVIHAADDRVEETPVSMAPSLQQMQDLLGGDAEIIPMFTRYNGVSCVAFMDGLGKLRNKPINLLASLLWHQQLKDQGILGSPRTSFLVGDIVVLLGRAREGWI